MNLLEFEIKYALLCYYLMHFNFDSALDSMNEILSSDLDQDVKSSYADYLESLPSARQTLIMNRGELLIREGEYVSALKYFSKGNSEVYPYVALCFHKMGLENLAQLYRDRSDNASVLAHESFASMFYDQGDFSSAIQELKDAQKLQFSVDRLYKLSTYLICSGDFRSGWDLYESRFYREDFPVDFPVLERPRWDGSFVNSILVHWEQGFGDTIMFCRFLPLLKHYANSVFVAVRSPLQRLIQENFDFVTVISPEDVSSLKYDCYVPFMSLIRDLKLDLLDVKGSAYLKADAKPVHSAKKKVGISWQGNSSGLPERNMHILDLEPLIRMPDIQLYSFQKGLGLSNALPLFQDLGIVDLGSQVQDFYDTASLLMSMDLFVTTDNCLANLAGALGVPTVMMLSKSPEFRWMNAHDKTVWYDSIQIFRQERFNDWSECVLCVKNLILQLAGNKDSFAESDQS